MTTSPESMTITIYPISDTHRYVVEWWVPDFGWTRLSGRGYRLHRNAVSRARLRASISNEPVRVIDTRK